MSVQCRAVNQKKLQVINPFVQGDPGQDFFDQNPELKYITPFKRLIKEEGKKKASKIMWVAYLYADTRSKFFRYPPNERRELIEQNYWEDEFDWDEYQWLFDEYEQHAMSRDERQYKRAEMKFEEMMNFYLEQDEDETSNTHYNKVRGYFKDLPNLRETIRKWRLQIKESRKKQHDMRGGQKSGGLWKNN